MKKLLVLLPILLFALGSGAQVKINPNGGGVKVGPTLKVAATTAEVCSGSIRNGTSLVTSGCKVAAGNTLIIGIVTSGPSTTVTSVTDSVSDTITQVVARGFHSGSGGIEIWAVCSSAGGASVTITANFSASANADLNVHVVSGLSSSSCFDKSANAGGNNALPDSGNTATLSTAVEYVFGMLSAEFLMPATQASGYTFGVDQMQYGFPSMSGYKRVVATTAVKYNTSLAISCNWTATVATFK